MNDDRINIKQRRGDGKGVSYRIVSTPSTILNTNLCCWFKTKVEKKEAQWIN